VGYYYIHNVIKLLLEKRTKIRINKNQVMTPFFLIRELIRIYLFSDRTKLLKKIDLYTYCNCIVENVFSREKRNSDMQKK